MNPHARVACRAATGRRVLLRLVSTRSLHGVVAGRTMIVASHQPPCKDVFGSYSYKSANGFWLMEWFLLRYLSLIP